jgi:hypothetical protein
VYNEGWNWNLLATWIPMHIKDKIAALLPPNSSAGEDMQVCKENSMGNFSISAMYHVLCDCDLNTLDPVWHHIRQQISCYGLVDSVMQIDFSSCSSFMHSLLLCKSISLLDSISTMYYVDCFNSGLLLLVFMLIALIMDCYY